MSVYSTTPFCLPEPPPSTPTSPSVCPATCPHIHVSLCQSACLSVCMSLFCPGCLVYGVWKAGKTTREYASLPYQRLILAPMVALKYVHVLAVTDDYFHDQIYYPIRRQRQKSAPVLAIFNPTQRYSTVHPERAVTYK